MSTVSVTTLREYTELVKPSLATFVEHPFGLTLGDVGDSETQTAIVRQSLELVSQDHQPGTIVELPYSWSKDDYRELQLKKKRK